MDGPACSFVGFKLFIVFLTFCEKLQMEFMEDLVSCSLTLYEDCRSAIEINKQRIISVSNSSSTED